MGSNDVTTELFTTLTTTPLWYLIFVGFPVIVVWRFIVKSRYYYRHAWVQPKDRKPVTDTDGKIRTFMKRAHNTGLFRLWFSCLVSWFCFWMVLVGYILLIGWDVTDTLSPNYADDPHPWIKVGVTFLCMISSAIALLYSIFVGIYEKSRAARITATLFMCVLAFSLANLQFLLYSINGS